MSRSISFPVRKLVTLAAGIPLAAAGLLMMTTGTASAHHSLIKASADCSGVVKFTSSSWSTGAQGTNSKVGIFVAIDSGAFQAVAPVNGATIVSATGVKYEFSAANGFKFSDTFTVPNHSKPVKVTVKSQPLANWGNGVAPGGAAITTVDVPAPCSTNNTTTTVKPTTTTVKPTTTTVYKATTTTVKETTTTTAKATTTTVAPTTTTTEAPVVLATTTSTTEAPEVLTQQIASQELAETGTDTITMSAFGFILLLIGGTLIIFGRPVVGAHTR